MFDSIPKLLHITKDSDMGIFILRKGCFIQISSAYVSTHFSMSGNILEWYSFSDA